MSDYRISENVLNGVLKYLSLKPYHEVSQLINAIQTAEPIQEENKKPAKKRASESTSS